MEEECDDKDDTKRRTRNLSEKKRRDQFNMLVNELSSMVSTNNRKMDKSTVLKSTISFLKNHNDIILKSRAHDVQEDWKPSFLPNQEFTYLMLEALEGFLMVFSSTGQIYYISESITTLLGHSPADLVNQSLFDLAHEEDRPNLYGLLQSVDPLHQGNITENEIRFQCNLKRGSFDFRNDTTYELIQFYGHFRSTLDDTENDEDPNYPQDPESQLLFVCTGRLQTPHLIRDVSLVDTLQNEFTSRHSLEWKFLFLDHRAPPIIGYLPFEVLGTSGYDYYHFDDLEKVVSCHEALMQKGEMTSCYYRFLTKGQQWIWLQTRFYITYHQWSSKPEFVVCTHRVVSYTDISNNMKQESAEGDNESEADTRGLVTVNSEEGIATMSPSLSETSDLKTESAFSNNYQHMSQAATVKSASASSTTGTVATAGTATTQWKHQLYPPHPGSDTGSLSGDERASRHDVHASYAADRWCQPRAGSDSGDERSSLSQRNSEREVHKDEEPPVAPQHGMGAQYLDPAPYVGAVGVGGIISLPLQSLPVLVTADQAQVQDQLQRKHEELQQMIVRQQAELRQVKEQLLLARLGILQPIINQAQYMNSEEFQQPQHIPTQILYEPRPAIMDYPPPHPPNPPHPHTPQ